MKCQGELSIIGAYGGYSKTPPKHAPIVGNSVLNLLINILGSGSGFDDSSLASNEALEGIVLNWDRWRLKVIDKNKHAKQSLETLEHNLEQIGYRLAFDQIAVKIDGST